MSNAFEAVPDSTDDFELPLEINAPGLLEISQGIQRRESVIARKSKLVRQYWNGERTMTDKELLGLTQEVCDLRQAQAIETHLLDVLIPDHPSVDPNEMFNPESNEVIVPRDEEVISNEATPPRSNEVFIPKL